MKKIMFLIFIVAIISGCDDNKKLLTNEETPRLPWGSFGEFYSTDEINIDDTYQLGPLTLNLEEIMLVEGHFNQTADTLQEEKRYFLTVLFTPTLTVNDQEITFAKSNFALQLPSGEIIETDDNVTSVITSWNIIENQNTFNVSFELEEEQYSSLNEAKLMVEGPMMNDSSSGDHEVIIDIEF